MNIAFLDAHTLTADGLSLTPLKALGSLSVYDRTSPKDIISRAFDADIIISNKVVIDRNALNSLPNLKYICVCATGYNNIDIATAREKGIPVSNVSGYSTHGVVQHVFALILNVLNKIDYYNTEIRNDRWVSSLDFCFYDHSIHELSGLTIGIYGYGTIGEQIGNVAHAFGMNVLAHKRNPIKNHPFATFVSADQLFQHSDILTLHASLNESNFGIINSSTIEKMKDSCILVNTGRGGLINEDDLAVALNSGNIRHACLDVLSTEPPKKDNPLLSAKNCDITPHIAWASRDSREKLLQGLVDNIQSFTTRKSILNKVN